KSVGNHNHGLHSMQMFNLLNDFAFGFVIQRTCSFIENQNVSAMIEGASKGYALPLPTRESNAPLTNMRAKSLWKLGNERFQTCLAQCEYHPIIINFII